ncbi:MAG: tetratricopeptide repeat protein, partial [Deltaproteobacteria bacterium]|nr:tetratricopeptide repeat protein [Deltaproteobacteria bacterium]
AASPTAPMPTAALDCLQRQLGEFEGLTTLLAEGRPHVSVRARELAASLAPVDACAQPSLGRPSMPTAGEERVVALDLRARLDRARMLREAGDIDDAGTLIEQTLHAAERADAVTYAAALLQHGHFQKDALRPKAAEQDFREVWRRAEHLGEDGLAIDAVVSLSTATLDTPGRVVQGLDLLDIADAKIARHGGDRRRTLNSTIQRATLLHRQGSLDEALAQAEHSVALAEALYGQGAPQLAIPLGALALTQTAAGHYDACMASTRRALDIAVLHFGKAAPITAVTTQNLGAISSSLGKYRQAIVLYGEALELLRRLHGDPSEPVAMVLSNIGAAELSLGRIEAALVSSRAARDAYLHSVGPDYIGIGYTHSNLATVMRERGYMSETKAARAESIRVWTHALSADHPLLRGARIGQAVDDAIFTPSVSTFDVLSRRLLPSLDDDAIDPATRADGAFMLAVHLAKAQPARARRLLERARRLGTPRVLANIEAWERSQLQPLGVVPG